MCLLMSPFPACCLHPSSLGLWVSRSGICSTFVRIKNKTPKTIKPPSPSTWKWLADLQKQHELLLVTNRWHVSASSSVFSISLFGKVSDGSLGLYKHFFAEQRFKFCGDQKLMMHKRFMFAKRCMHQMCFVIYSQISGVPRKRKQISAMQDT